MPKLHNNSLKWRRGSCLPRWQGLQADLDIARRQLADKDERLAAVEERVRLTEAEATEAQQRAMEANAAIEKIVGAIRSQLPGREDLSARV